MEKCSSQCSDYFSPNDLVNLLTVVTCIKTPKSTSSSLHSLERCTPSFKSFKLLSASPAYRFLKTVTKINIGKVQFSYDLSRICSQIRSETHCLLPQELLSHCISTLILRKYCPRYYLLFSNRMRKTTTTAKL